MTKHKELRDRLVASLPGILPLEIQDGLIASVTRNPEPSYNSLEEACINGYFMQVYPKYSYSKDAAQEVVNNYIQKRLEEGNYQSSTLRAMYINMGITFLEGYVNGLGNYDVSFKQALAKEFPSLNIYQWNDLYNLVIEHIGNSSFKQKHKMFKQLVGLIDNAYSIGYKAALNAQHKDTN